MQPSGPLKKQRDMRLFTAVLFLAASAVVFGQPGPEGYLSVNVVDESGNPIPDARVLEASVTPGRVVIEGHNIFDNPPSKYLPRDAERSSFVGLIVCGRKTSIAVQAAGYASVIKEDVARTCPAEVTITLIRTNEQPAYPKKLITLSGLIKNHNGLPLDGWFRIFEENKQYVPRVAPDGSFTAKLSAGTYVIKFEHHRCNLIQIANYRVGPDAKTLDLYADCK